jgi:hypothetical protein
MINFEPLSDTDKREISARYSPLTFEMTMVIEDAEAFEVVRHAATARATAYIDEGGVASEFDQSILRLPLKVVRVFMYRSAGAAYLDLLGAYEGWAYIHDSADSFEEILARRDKAGAAATDFAVALQTHDIVQQTDFAALTEQITEALDPQWSDMDQMALAAAGASLPNLAIPEPRAPEDVRTYFKSVGRALFNFLS